MSLNWKTVRAVDVEQACQLVESGARPVRTPSKGIFIIHNGNPLPAKHVLRLAYCIANRVPLDRQIDFVTGESTVKLLNALGFQVQRVGTTLDAHRRIASWAHFNK